MVVLQQLRI